MAHRTDSNKKGFNETGEFKLVECELGKENSSLEIKSGIHNIIDGDGEIIDRDGRIMKISTDSYEKFIPKNGKLESFDKNVLTSTDVVLVIWKYRVSGTGKWHGKNMKMNKKRPEPRGQLKELVFLWGGKESNELELGEAALLTTELKLGTCYNVTTGLEPGAFLKAFDGQLRIEDCAKGVPKMYCCLGTENGSYLQQVENSKSSLRNESSFVIIDHDKKTFSSTNNCLPVENLSKAGFEEIKWSMDPLEIPLESKSEEIKKLFKIEKLIDQLVPIQLKTVRSTGRFLFNQAQLSGVNIVITDNSIYLWHEVKDTEGKILTFFKYFVQSSKQLLGIRVVRKCSWKKREVGKSECWKVSV